MSEAKFLSAQTPSPGFYEVSEKLTTPKPPNVKFSKLPKKRKIFLTPSFNSYSASAEQRDKLDKRISVALIGREDASRNPPKVTSIHEHTQRKEFIPGVGKYELIGKEFLLAKSYSTKRF